MIVAATDRVHPGALELDQGGGAGVLCRRHVHVVLSCGIALPGSIRPDRSVRRENGELGAGAKAVVGALVRVGPQRRGQLVAGFLQSLLVVWPLQDDAQQGEGDGRGPLAAVLPAVDSEGPHLQQRRQSRLAQPERQAQTAPVDNIRWGVGSRHLSIMAQSGDTAPGTPLEALRML